MPDCHPDMGMHVSNICMASWESLRITANCIGIYIIFCCGAFGAAKMRFSAATPSVRLDGELNITGNHGSRCIVVVNYESCCTVDGVIAMTLRLRGYLQVEAGYYSEGIIQFIPWPACPYYLFPRRPFVYIGFDISQIYSTFAIA